MISRFIVTLLRVGLHRPGFRIVRKPGRFYFVFYLHTKTCPPPKRRRPGCRLLRPVTRCRPKTPACTRKPLLCSFAPPISSFSAGAGARTNRAFRKICATRSPAHRRAVATRREAACGQAGLPANRRPCHGACGEAERTFGNFALKKPVSPVHRLFRNVSRFTPDPADPAEKRPNL